MRLGRQVQDRARPVLGEDARHRRAIGDVGLDEGDARIVQRALETEQAAGVGQLVDDDEAIGGVGERVVNEIGADEAGAAGDEKRVIV